jgi:hypothetical protein
MSENKKPLWPKTIEVIGCTGEYESGKSTFSVTISPGPDTLVYDFEKSTGSYEADLRFIRVDVPNEMQKRFPNGYKPIDVFKWWLGHVHSIPAGQYRVIVADPASDIEQGLADYVLANPREFGKTPAQYMKMAALMWGDMKAKWKQILADIAARCETFCFTTHQQAVWKGDKPSKERKAKGKETLFEMASLYLKFERKKDKDAVPSAIVLKSRLSKIIVADDEDGTVTSIPLLPPRLPKATPAAVRRYMQNPPDYTALKPEELVGETTLSEDEKLLLRAQIADAERDTALAENEREERQGRLGRVSNSPVVSSTPQSSPPAQAPDEPEAEAEPKPETEPEQENAEEAVAITGETIQQIVDTPPSQPQYADPAAPVGKGQLGALRNAIARYLKKWPEKQEAIAKGIKKRNPKAQSEADLTNGQAEDMEASLLRILNGPHENQEPAKQEVTAHATTKRE